MTIRYPFDPGKDQVRDPEHAGKAGADMLEEERFWVLLNVYCDGEASEAEILEVEQALRSDAQRATDLNFLRMLSDHVQAVPEIEPPASLRASILQATTQRATFGRRMLAGMEALRALWTGTANRVVVPAGAVAAAVLLTTLWPHQREQSTELSAGTPSIAAERTRTGAEDPIPVEKQVVRAPVSEGGDTRATGPAVPARIEKSPASVRVATAHAYQQRERQKREFVERPQVRGPEINVVLLTENGRPIKQSVRPRLAFRPVRPQAALLQDNGTAGDPRVMPAGYSYAPRPMMEREYQRRVEVGTIPETRSEPLTLPDVEPGDGVPTRGGAEAGGAAAAGNDQQVASNNSNTPAAEATTVPRTTIFRSNRPMPIFTRRYVSGADLKREREAAMLGYTRSAVLSIERTELAGNMVGRF